MTTPTKYATIACPFCGRLNRIDLARAAERPKCGDCSRPLLLDRPIRVGDADLDRVVAGTSVPILVDFYADWCAPCKIMAPLLDDLAASRAGHLVVAKLDTDRNPAMSARFQIRSIPTLLLFSDGREIGREIGAVPRQRILQLLDRAAAPRA